MNFQPLDKFQIIADIRPDGLGNGPVYK
jgi:hypothetical protein